MDLGGDVRAGDDAGMADVDLFGVTTKLGVGGQRAGCATHCLGLPGPGSVRFADDRGVRLDVVALLAKLGEQLVDVPTFGQQAVDVDP